MEGRLNSLLLLIFVLAAPSVTSAYESPYKFYFQNPKSGTFVTVDSIEEVYEMLAAWGPEFAVLEVSAERKLADGITEFTFSAPPPSPVPGEAYLSFWNGGVDAPDIAYTLEDAEKLLFRRFPGWDEKYRSAVWTGTMPDYPPYSGAEYRAYTPYSLPAPPQIYPSPYGVPNRPCGPEGWSGGVLASFNGGIMKGPDVVSIHQCSGRWQKPRIYGKFFWIRRIETRNGFVCGEGYYPTWSADPSSCHNPYVVLVERRVECNVAAAKPLEHWIEKYHQNDPQMTQLTRQLEDGVSVSLRDMLTPEAQQAEACVGSKFVAGGFAYKLESTRRPLAYQAHFHDLYQRWLEHGSKVDEGSPEWEACAERREQVELEMGKRVGSDLRDWNAPGGRFHQIVQASSPERSKHPDGNAIDVSGVGEVITYLTKDGPPTMTVQDWVNHPNDCGVGWGGLFLETDPPHFYLRNGEQQMEFITLIAALTAGMEPDMPPELPERLHHGEPQWTRLLVSGEHIDGDIVYHYTIVNQHPDTELTHLQLGVEYENGAAGPDLVEKPVGTEIMIEPHPTQPGFNQFWAEMPDNAWTAPPHWELNFIKMEYFPRFYLEFWLQRASKQASVGEVQPGQQLEGFSIRLPKADPTYYETGFEASYYYPSKNYFGYPEKLDTTPPELSVSVDRPSIWPPNNKLVDINVDIDVTDDYDGRPAITLVSITANEPLEDGDIQGADFGTDDRLFQLRASRDGGTQEGRIYTVTYEATDAMANSVRKTVEVVVPHDRRR